ncbi:MAG: SPFH domain-containing protein [Oscillospiraceae bacterium]|jgi:membrane protease subunit (stomatin/prohibitin family)|nr:SPFH domain-containing protein [Oscillospiraceae bacterium]
MGLIKAAVGTVKGVLADSWKDVVVCPPLSNSVIVADGVKQNDKNSSNTKGSAKVISNGSVILVEENTCMLTIDGGKITNVVAEPGSYTYNNTTAPSIFAGDIAESVAEMVNRFTFGGGVAGGQRVVFINLQPIPNNTFGTVAPVPFPEPRYNTTVELRFFGTYEVQIKDAEAAVKFYRDVAGKQTGGITAQSLFRSPQYLNEFLQAISSAVVALGNSGVSYNQLGMHTYDLTEKVRQITEKTWAARGLTVTNIALNPPTLSDESKSLLGDRLKADTMLGADVQRAMMNTSIARGIEAAGSNKGGAMLGFAGINTAMGTGGAALAGFGAAPATTPNQVRNPNSWTCACGQTNEGNFCIGCGKSKEGIGAQSSVWKCACGATSTAKFCAVCGKPKPVEKKYKCNRCGFTPTNPSSPPKFCPECGDVFNDDDVVG